MNLSRPTHFSQRRTTHYVKVLAIATLIALVGQASASTAKPAAKAGAKAANADFVISVNPAQIAVAAGSSASASAQLTWAPGTKVRPKYRLVHKLKGTKISIVKPGVDGATIKIVTTNVTPVQTKTLTIVATSGGKTRKFTAMVAIARTVNTSAAPANPSVPAPAPPDTPATAPVTTSSTSATTVATTPPTNATTTLNNATTTTATTTTTTTTTTTIDPRTTIKKTDLTPKLKPYVVTGSVTNVLLTPSGLSTQVSYNHKGDAPNLSSEIEIGFESVSTLYSRGFPSGKLVASAKSTSVNGAITQTISGLKPGSRYEIIIRAYDGKGGIDTTLAIFYTKRRVVTVVGDINLLDDSDPGGSGEMFFYTGANGEWLGFTPRRDMHSSSTWDNFITLTFDYNSNENLSLAVFGQDDDGSPFGLSLTGVTPDGDGTYVERGSGETEKRPENGDDSAMVWGEVTVMPIAGRAEYTGELFLRTTAYDVKFEATLKYSIKYV